jgi:ABC-2 type transport system permease protein
MPKPFWMMVKQQGLLLWRYPLNMIANFVMVLVMVLVVTLLVSMFTQAGQAKDMALYGFAVYLFLNHTIWTIGIGVYKDRVAGALSTFYLSPTSRFWHLAARATVALLWTTIAAAIGLVVAQFFVGRLQVQQAWLVLGILSFTISGLVGFGFAIAGLALLFGESIEIIANLIEFGLIGLCALFFPFSILPPALLAVSRLIPFSYGIDALRSVALGLPQPELLPLNLELVIVVVFGLLSPLIGYALYHLCETKMRRQGLL